MDELFGYIERITFQNPENGYTVAQLKSPNQSEFICIVGSLPALQPGETVRCQGDWKNHLVFGKQFVVAKYRTEAPADVEGIRKYLGSGLVKGIGAKYASRIVDAFGKNTLEIIDSSPERLLEVEGLGKKRVEKICGCWGEQKSIREVMIFLQSHGVSPSYAQKIFKTYGKDSIAQVKANPYQLAKDIHGVGFKSADKIAQALGMAKDAPERVDAGVEYTLLECSDDGHVCMPIADFLTTSHEILEVSQALIEQRLSALHAANRIELGEMVFEGVMTKFIWLKWLFLSEVGICRQLSRLQRSPCNLRAIDTQKALDWVQTTLNLKLAKNQIQAVSQALSEKVQIITGGPGTGKSTITKAILAITEKLTDKIVLAAPTGRASKRMSEITGKKSKTIHSLLEYDFKAGKFKRGLEFPLDCDLIIIDEASMIDTSLMYSILKAIPSHARAIFLGDINQLPSVGPGNVLKDIIASRCLPVTLLNEIFRQAAGSRIITNAHRINNGTFPEINNSTDSDFFFMDVDTPEDVTKNIVALVTQRLPKKYGFDPFNDIQVLAPMKRGAIGTENLNIVLQQHLNPKGTPLLWAGKRLLPGDKVMQIRNDHKREVYNGDVGRIHSIDPVEQQVIITIDDRQIVYDYSDLDALVLAYAASVHKFQGSECPCIVMPVHTTHFKLLHRNLLYTGITRGKRLVVLVGTKKALAMAVKNDEVKRRHTGLCQALLGAFMTQVTHAL